jgi:hypothetical protein
MQFELKSVSSVKGTGYPRWQPWLADLFEYVEIEFLDISLTKDSSLLLHAIHSLSTGGFKKSRLYFCFKNTHQKVCEIRKLKSIRE